MDKRTICLLNDSFPPEIDGVANAVVNYAKNITKSGENAIVVTPTMPGADDSAFPFPVLRYPSIDTRKKLGYVAGYPFSPETARVLTEQKVELMHTHCPITSCLLARSLRAVVDAPLVLTYHTKYDVDIAKAVRGKLLQESAIRALVQNIASCDEVWVVSRGAAHRARRLCVLIAVVHDGAQDAVGGLQVAVCAGEGQRVAVRERQKFGRMVGRGEGGDVPADDLNGHGSFLSGSDTRGTSPPRRAQAVLRRL